VPIHIETISGFSRNFPLQKEEFWQHYDKRPEALRGFERCAKKRRTDPALQSSRG
jgi:hypothetical protein